MSKLPTDNIPIRDFACGEKLAATGGVLLGKNTNWEFPHGDPSWDVLFPCRTMPELAAVCA